MTFNQMALYSGSNIEIGIFRRDHGDGTAFGGIGGVCVPEWAGDHLDRDDGRGVGGGPPVWKKRDRMVLVFSGGSTYGGSKRNGSRPPHFCKSSGSVARNILQQLQNLNIIDFDPKGGMRITSSGQLDLDQIKLLGRLWLLLLERKKEIGIDSRNMYCSSIPAVGIMAKEALVVAVKVLKGLKGNGEEFIDEVATISRTSHVNIVTLLGFYFEGRHRALVYEFMPNRSLDKFIHDGEEYRATLPRNYFQEILVGFHPSLDLYSYGMMVLEMVGGRKNISVEIDRMSEIYFPHWLHKRLEPDEELGLHGIMDGEANASARKMVIVCL
ncbi:hypothetical protein RHSIM_Rhsim10G0096800 [Rhododendron simsii]|uniref:Protein kinase domain-containing protein n=1 Tax=Rhododendron simsii TaxID=118357 RepID=A0A834LCU9_RHOSS|nr:hypothetical protein RHSIM_Rhsim10G0096800 [Rhododendron simsii]